MVDWSFLLWCAKKLIYSMATEYLSRLVKLLKRGILLTCQNISKSNNIPEITEYIFCQNQDTHRLEDFQDLINQNISKSDNIS